VGGKQQVIEETVEKLKKEFRGINILNYRNGYIKNKQQVKELIYDIKTLKPDVVFVAMGSPKQELLMEEIQKFHKATYQGLGGSFDVYTGHVERAPQWWIKSNLEWAYRLIKQPSRIRRQIYLFKFYLNLQLNRY
jgi:UDP-N-acetyl-D-mannosaminouronate:lipid I N-acetyl-D-mannosaminouronosyltransferase